MSTNYVVVMGGFVTNYFFWDFPDPPPVTEGIDYVEYDPTTTVVNIDYTAVEDEEGHWTFAAPVIPPPTPEEILAANRPELLNRLNAVASTAMSHVLLSMDFTGKTDDESMAAKSWQEYYIALKSTDITLVNPAWPELPEV